MVYFQNLAYFLEVILQDKEGKKLPNSQNFNISAVYHIP